MVSNMPVRRLILAASTCLTLAACDTWMGEAEDASLPGKRISVLVQDRAVQPDAGAAAIEVRLPPPEANDAWPQAGGYAAHAMHHMQLDGKLERVWSTSIGSGSGDRARLLSQPVVADGRVFGMDADTEVSAIDAATGARKWTTSLTPEDDEDGGLGGGLAYSDGRLFAATGYGEVVALAPADGTVLWRRRVSAPVRGAPTVRGGRVLVVSVDNQTHALAADDGRLLWTHSGLAEIASVLGGSSPAIDGSVAVVPYSSGEVFALRLENGATQWSESLTGIHRTGAASSLADIRGLPVVDRGRVYVAASSDMLAAIDLRSGRRVWDRQLGSLQTPWLAGDFLFIISNNNELTALEAKSGRVKWVLPLQRWEDEDDKTGAVVWTGPVLASDRLIVVGSNGWALSVSPYTGEVLGREEMPDAVNIPPVVAAGTLYFLTDDGDLIAYR